MKFKQKLAFILLFPTGILLAQIQEAIDNFSKYPDFANASITFAAVDVSTGEVLGKFNEHNSLPSASTAKLFSSASAFEILGPKYQPTTKFYIDGNIDANGVLKGNLIIRAGGDPTAGSKYFYGESDNTFFRQIADSLKAKGIKTIIGDIIADASQFGYQGAPDGWNWSDMGNYYGAGPAGLCIYDNMLKFNFKTGKAGTTAELISTFPEVLNLDFTSYILASIRGGDNSYIYSAPFSSIAFGHGELPQNQSLFTVKGTQPDPEFAYAKEVYTTIQSLGIRVDGGFWGKRILLKKGTVPFDYSNLIPLFEMKKFTILDIATPTNMNSINMFAEQFICLIGYEKGKSGSTQDGLEYIEKYWASRINTKGLYLKDGSGLSRSNAINAMNFCSLLTYMYKSKNSEQFMSTLPVAGVSGTLKSVCRNQTASGKLIAKSGTMTRIKSYSGYVNTKSGKTLAFALVVNNYHCSNSFCVDQMEKVFNVMAGI